VETANEGGFFITSADGRRPLIILTNERAYLCALHLFGKMMGFLKRKDSSGLVAFENG
jgi:hypothetical protein